VPPEPGRPSPSSPTTMRPWCPRLSMRSARRWNDGRYTASSMPRPGPRTISTVAVRHAAGSHSVHRLPQRSSGPRQGPAHGKNPQVPHPHRPCQARRGEDRSARRVDAGNQQWQCVIGGESASVHGGRCIVPAGGMAGTYPASRGYDALGLGYVRYEAPTAHKMSNEHVPLEQGFEHRNLIAFTPPRPHCRRHCPPRPRQHPHSGHPI